MNFFFVTRNCKVFTIDSRTVKEIIAYDFTNRGILKVRGKVYKITSIGINSVVCSPVRCKYYINRLTGSKHRVDFRGIGIAPAKVLCLNLYIKLIL